MKSKAEQDHHEWNWTELWKKETFLKLELLDGINAYYLGKPPNWETYKTRYSLIFLINQPVIPFNASKWNINIHGRL